jgi:hypothetical protein
MTRHILTRVTSRRAVGLRQARSAARCINWHDDTDECSAYASIARHLHGHVSRDLVELRVLEFVPASPRHVPVPFVFPGRFPSIVDADVIASATLAGEVAGPVALQYAAAMNRWPALSALDNGSEDTTAHCTEFTNMALSALRAPSAAANSFDGALAWTDFTCPSRAWHLAPYLLRLGRPRRWDKATSDAVRALVPTQVGRPESVGAEDMLCRWVLDGSACSSSVELAAVANGDNPRELAMRIAALRRVWTTTTDEAASASLVAEADAMFVALAALGKEKTSRAVFGWELVAATELFQWHGTQQRFDIAVNMLHESAARIESLFAPGSLCPIDRGGLCCLLMHCVNQLQVAASMVNHPHALRITKVKEHVVRCAAAWIEQASIAWADGGLFRPDALGLHAAWLKVHAADTVVVQPRTASDDAAVSRELRRELASFDVIRAPPLNGGASESGHVSCGSTTVACRDGVDIVDVARSTLQSVAV